MDSSIHRLSESQVLSHHGVPEDHKLALRCFLKSWHGSDEQGEWMRAQHGWKDAAALLASAPYDPATVQITSKGWASSGINPYRILLCGFGRKLCGRGNQCRRCALDRIDFAQSELVPAFEKANHWYAMVLAMDRRADYAGIHRGDRTLNPKTPSVPVYQPFKGRSDGWSPLHSGAEVRYLFDATRDGFFDAARVLCKTGLLDGAFAHFEISFSFWSGASNYDLWSHIRHRVEPQLNLLVNSPKPLDAHAVKRVYEVMAECLRRRLGPEHCWSYPDLWFAPVLDEKRMSGWIAYMLKSWRFDRWYQDALKHRCDRRELNLCFDEVVFVNGHRLASAKSSTRRYGNLHYTPKKPSANIAHRIPPEPTQEQIRLLQDDQYAATHPEIVDAMFFWADKREKRRGRRESGRDIKP